MLSFANVIWGARCGKSARRVLLGETSSRDHAYSVRRRRESESGREAPHGLPSSRLVSTIPFDRWIRREVLHCAFARYADGAIVHCQTERMARWVKQRLAERFVACGLELHPDKTRVVYCRDSNRRADYPVTQFTFLGFTFRPRCAQTRDGRLFTSFLPGASREALTRMRRQIRGWHLPRQTPGTLAELSATYDATLRGWGNYYCSFYPTAMVPVFQHFDLALAFWARRKYKTLARHKRRSRYWLAYVARREPHRFVHWRHWYANDRTLGAV
jgi:RNA-directed DNA polymerase